ncbi:hypothetical protein BDW22DRAFT_959279 [Trametopsis cervina]|nr:hypothetical protein BDW22DRAFT_959279 [Trametopsis cervina]
MGTIQLTLPLSSLTALLAYLCRRHHPLHVGRIYRGIQAPVALDMWGFVEWRVHRTRPDRGHLVTAYRVNPRRRARAPALVWEAPAQQLWRRARPWALEQALHGQGQRLRPLSGELQAAPSIPLHRSRRGLSQQQISIRWHMGGNPLVCCLPPYKSASRSDMARWSVLKVAKRGRGMSRGGLKRGKKRGRSYGQCPPYSARHMTSGAEIHSHAPIQPGSSPIRNHHKGK